MKKAHTLSDIVIMKRLATPILMACLTIAGLLLLPGFKQATSDDQFPAPLEAPAAALYLNFSVSGIYDQGEAAKKAANSITELVAEFCHYRNNTTNINQIRPIIENLINDRISNGIFKAYELFFYYKEATNFALILHGEFALTRIAELIGKERVTTGEESISGILRLPFLQNARLYLFCGNDQLVICPEDSAGNIINLVRERRNLLKPEYDSFAKMVKARPAMAAEVNIELLQKNNSQIPFARYLQPMKHLRLIVANRLAKLQLFVPDNQERENFARQVEAQFIASTSFPANLASFTNELNGSSIFIEAPGSKELERTISNYSSAFLLHFFVKAQKNQLVVSCKENDES